LVTFGHFWSLLVTLLVYSAWCSGKVGIMVGVEGGYAIGNNLELLRVYYRLGVRIFTFTHSKSLPWASACTDSPWTPEVAGMTLNPKTLNPKP
jgi:microsomal dipeptidase-like Zn-dependent dipeptidase